MNLKLPTLLLSMPVQMPIGGLLMMLMMSPTLEKKNLLKDGWDCFIVTADVSLSKYSHVHVKRGHGELPWVWGSPCHMDWEQNPCGLELGHRTVRDTSRPPPASDCLSDQSHWTHWSHHLNPQTQHSTGGLHTHLRVLLVNTTHLFTMSGCALWADTYWRSSGHCKDSPRSCLSVWSFSQLEGCFLSLHLALCLCHRPEGKQKTTRPTVLKGSNVT